MSVSARDFFTAQQKESIVIAVKQAELNTSGEIRVHIEDTCHTGAVLDRAAFIFKQLEMHKTVLRNGVLFYLAIKSRKFAIIGDVAINAKVPEGFWDEVKEKMSAHFREGDFSAGLTNGIVMAGEKLKQHFPYQSDDVNELPDEISFGKH